MCTDISDSKNNLRRKLRRLIRSYSDEERGERDTMIADQILSSAAFKQARCIFMFLGETSRMKEIDTRRIFEAGRTAGKTLCLPLCADPETAPGIMDFRVVSDLSELKSGAYGISEPSEAAALADPAAADLVLVPCIGMALNGKRLGQGGGYYDRFFAANPDLIDRSIVLCPQCCVFDTVPADERDISFKTCVTEEGFINLG